MLEIKKQWKKRLYRIGFVAAIVYTFLSSNIYMLITVLAHICMKYKNDIWKRKEPIQYGLLDKFWMVLASSIKQAYYCASRNIWSNGVKVGILGTRKGEMKDGEAIWKYFDGHTSHNKEYSHMQTIKVK